MGYCDQTLMWQTYPPALVTMFNKNKEFRAGSEVQYGPRIAGEILHDYLENSNEPLAVAYRERHEESEGETDQLFKTVFPNTEVAVNLKLLTRKPGRLPVEASLEGVLTRRSEDDFLFIQNASEKRTAAPRNPHLYRGSCINVVRKRVHPRIALVLSCSPSSSSVKYSSSL